MRLLAVVTLLVGAFLDCRSRDEEEVPLDAIDARPQNLVLVTVDTLRADHLSCYGYTSSSTPTFDRIASEGVLFEQAVAHVPLTLPSHASILTGLLPPNHGVRENGTFHLPEGVETMATRLHRKGFRAGAFVGAYPLHSRFGLARGFERYDDRLPQSPDNSFFYSERRAEEVVAEATRWLESVEEPFFLWVHVFDPHHPYVPPLPFAPHYDGEIAYVDRVLEGFLDDLEERALLDRSLLVVMADHGESLGEHGEDTHGVFLYDATLRIPLLMRFPDALPAGLRIPWLVRVVDVAPTVLDLLGIPLSSEVDGESVLQAVLGRAEPPELGAYIESYYAAINFGWSPLVGARNSRFKLIEAPRAELYDLREDPGEQRNVFDSRADEAGGLHALFARMAPEHELEFPSPSTIDEETRRRLASLGYVSATPSKKTTEPDTRLDPKDGIELQKLLKLAMSAQQRGATEQATSFLATLLAKDPGNVRGRVLLGVLYQETGDIANATRELETALTHDPANGEGYRRLGKTLLASGDLDGAARRLEVAIRLDPTNPESHNDLGLVHTRRGDLAAAREQFEDAVRLDANLLEPKINLANAFVALGNLSRAETLYRGVLEQDAAHAPALNGLGVIAIQRGELQVAAGYLERSLRVDGEQVEASLNLAEVLDALGQPERAVPFYRYFLAKAPSRYQPRKEEVRQRLKALGAT